MIIFHCILEGITHIMCVLHWDAGVIGDITVAAIAASHPRPVVNAFAVVRHQIKKYGHHLAEKVPYGAPDLR
jgi:hypothetical protein